MMIKKMITMSNMAISSFIFSVESINDGNSQYNYLLKIYFNFNFNSHLIQNTKRIDSYRIHTIHTPMIPFCRLTDKKTINTINSITILTTQLAIFGRDTFLDTNS